CLHTLKVHLYYNLILKGTMSLNCLLYTSPSPREMSRGLGDVYKRQITEGAVNATVHIKTDAGFEIVAVVTNESQDEMKLTTGSRIIALIKASAILIATKA
ncbi:TOBE domain-containing protein, partial [Escherichia coli]